MCFPDKKGTLSVEGGETTVGSVTEGFYPPSTREPTCYLTPSLGGQSMSLRSGDNLSGIKWENNGLSNYRPKVLSYERRRPTKRSPSHPHTIWLGHYSNSTDQREACSYLLCNF
jgi:hypothetical protein